MSKFRKKPVVVEAFQMTKERRHYNRDWPAWLNEAWQQPENTMNALFIVAANTDREYLCLNERGRQMFVDWGSWIVRGEGGVLSAVGDALFAETYQAVESSNLEKHAEFELRRAGLFDGTSDYNGAIGEAVMGLVRTFSGEDHSGGSAQVTLAAFDRVVRFKTLTEITSDPAEWMHIAEEEAGQPNVWQSTRQSSCFSNDGGKTYYDIDANDERAIRTAAEPK